jgi:hypothetical protein
LRRSILCLANSYKHGGRCVAGIDPRDGAWIRLRGAAPDGTLQPAEYRLHDGSEPRLLDLIEVEAHYALPSDAHPEDWQIAPVRWCLLARPANPAVIRKALDTAGNGATILRDHRDRISCEEIAAKPMQASLALVCPSELHWWIRDDRQGKRRSRALFRRNHVTYDLSVTDPRWLERLNLLPAGIYPHSFLADAGAETWLTVSLSEAFHGWHYKLVASVIELPAGL